MKKTALERYAAEHGITAYFERWHALGESYRWLRIKGGPYVVNAGKIG